MKEALNAARPRLYKHAGVEIGKRLEVLRAFCRHVLEKGGCEDGQYKVKFIAKDVSRAREASFEDITRFTVENRGKVVIFGHKPTKSMAAKRKRYLDAGTPFKLRNPAAGSSPGLLALARKLEMLENKGEERGLVSRIRALIRAIAERESLRKQVDNFVAQTRVQPVPEIESEVARVLEDMTALVDRINECKKPVAIGQLEARKIFQDRMQDLTRVVWPIGTSDVKEILASAEKANAEGVIDDFVKGYLQIEKVNLGKGALDYSLYEWVLEFFDALENFCEDLPSEKKEQARSIGENAAVLAGFIEKMEDKERQIARLQADAPAKEGFEFLCEVATIRSGVLRLVKSIYQDIRDCSGDTHEFVLAPLQKMFIELIHTQADAEIGLWSALHEEGTKKRKAALEGGKKSTLKLLGSAQSERIQDYMKHLRQDLSISTGETEHFQALGQRKKEAAQYEARLLDRLEYLKKISPVEGKALEIAFAESKGHVKYKLGEPFKKPDEMLTPEKKVEVLLRHLESERIYGEESITVFGQKLASHAEYINKMADRLFDCNARMAGLCFQLGIVNASLEAYADMQGYLEGNMIDIKNMAKVSALVSSEGRNAVIEITYSEEYVEGIRNVILYDKQGEEMLAVPLHPEKFMAQETIHKSFNEVVIGDRFGMEDLGRMARDGEGIYQATVRFMRENLKGRVQDEFEIRNPESDLYWAALSNQRLMNGMVARADGFGIVENPPRLLGENQFEKMLVGKIGEEKFLQERDRFQRFRKMDAVIRILDAIHSRQQPMVLQELEDLIIHRERVLDTLETITAKPGQERDS